MLDMNSISTLLGQGRRAVDLICDTDSFKENVVGEKSFDDPTFGPGAIVGTAQLEGADVTIVANDGEAMNEKFPVVYAGVIGMEEAYKMAQAVYASIKADKEKPVAEKRPLILIVDTPGNGPGKLEEIFGMNKATGAYQLALAEARIVGHPVLAVVVGRAISGAFVCHGMHADQILALDAKFGTMIHVMPITSISRITNLDIEMLEELAKGNPVFAPGPTYYHRLGGVEEIIPSIEEMRPLVIKHVAEIRERKERGEYDTLGPWGRGHLGAERGGRVVWPKVVAMVQEQVDAVADKYMPGAA